MKRRITTLLLAAASIVSLSQAKEHKLFVGTYTDIVHLYSFDDATGALKKLSELSGIPNPSYLAHNGKYLYAVSETNGEKTPGQVVAIAYGPDGLKEINRVASGGDDPCYINLSGNKAVVSNYTSGNFSIFNISPNGSLYEALQTVDHKGSSTNSKRQSSPHVHSARYAANGKQLWVADLGTDRLSIYPIVKKGEADVDNVNHINITPGGSGPRHFDFHPTKPYIYLLNEMSGQIHVFAENQGEVTMIQRVENSELRPQNDVSGVASADIHITPNGKFLYASHRGLEDCITVYAIQKDGTLKQTSQQSTMGFNPRNFVISPNGQYLLVANGLSNEIVVMSINQHNGELTPLPQKTSVEKPVCLIF